MPTAWRCKATGRSSRQGGPTSAPRRLCGRALQCGRQLDTSFDGDGKVTTPLGSAHDAGCRLALQSDGRSCGGDFRSERLQLGFRPRPLQRGRQPGHLLRRRRQGDHAMGTANDYVYGVALQSDGKIVVAGDAAFGFVPDFGSRATTRTAAWTRLRRRRQGHHAGGGYDSCQGVALQSDGRSSRLVRPWPVRRGALPGRRRGRAPTVTINQAPLSRSDERFSDSLHVVFSEEVADFTWEDVSLTGRGGRHGGGEWQRHDL